MAANFGEALARQRRQLMALGGLLIGGSAPSSSGCQEVECASNSSRQWRSDGQSFQLRRLGRYSGCKWCARGYRRNSG